MVTRYELLTDEMLELDRVVRAGLCTRPASGPSAQSIDDAAREIIARAVIARGENGVILKMRAPLTGDESRKQRAALAILAEDEPDPWQRMRKAAAILRGEL